jgi:hypothetical protein
MSVPAPPTESAPWSTVEWAITGLSTLLASGAAFLWRLLLRLEKIESAQKRQGGDLDAMRLASDAAVLRLADRFAQLHDDHYRLRETMGALPTRSDLRALEDRLAERLNSVGDRLDRALDA